MFSCKNPPTIKIPLTTYVITQKFNEAAVGKRELNYKKSRRAVGEWIAPPEFISISDAPDELFCVSTEDWLKKIKPTLKAGSIFYWNTRNKK